MSKKQLTIPARIFTAAGLKQGQELTVTIDHGRIILTPTQQLIEQLAGSLSNTIPQAWHGKDVDVIIDDSRKHYFQHYKKHQ